MISSGFSKERMTSTPLWAWYTYPNPYFSMITTLRVVIMLKSNESKNELSDAQ